MHFVAEESCWEWAPHHGYELVKKLLRQGPPPRALLCLNDRLAFGAYQVLGEANLKIPDDVSIVSFDNDELASYLRPGLTTIGLRHEEMGRQAFAMLLSADEPREVLVPMPVMTRASV